MSELKNRYEFTVLFDVENGNPNGDPDAGNMPRVDVETSLGIVSDVCLKRKIRNYVEIVKEGKEGYNILVKTDKALNTKFKEAYEKCDLKVKDNNAVEIARDYICKNYFDVRTFGAVMSTGDNPCGIVRGPIQINFARSVDPILPQEITITRQAITDEKKFNDLNNKNGVMNEIGKKNIVPYGLYRAEGYVSALLANKTGFNEEDLEVFWEALQNMFETDHSAARGKMCVRKIYIFKHDSALGNAPSHTLFDTVKVEKKEGVDYPRCFGDYKIDIGAMPEGVTLVER